MAGKHFVTRNGRTGTGAFGRGWLLVGLVAAGSWMAGLPQAVGLAAEPSTSLVTQTSPEQAATLVLPSGLSDPKIYDAVRTLTQAGIFQFQPGEEWLGQWPVSRDELALWLYRLWQRWGEPPAAGGLPASAQTQLKAWVAQEVAAALAALPPTPAPTQHVVERDVVVQAGPGKDEMNQIAAAQAQAAVEPVVAQAQAAAAQAAKALADAAQAQAQAAASAQQDQQLQATLVATSQELQAAQQAVSVLQQRVAQLEQVQGAMTATLEQLGALSQQLQELQAALAQSDQRLTALDLRSASAQGDLETLRTLIDQRASALAQQMGVDRQQFQKELQAARDRLATVEKDYVRQEALAAVQALVNARTAQLEQALATLTASVQPELASLGQRVAAVEKRAQDQGQRLAQLEQRFSTPVQLALEWRGQQVQGDAAGLAAAAAAGLSSGGLLRQSWRAQVLGPAAAQTRIAWIQQTGTGLPVNWQDLEFEIPLGEPPAQVPAVASDGADDTGNRVVGGFKALAGVEGVPVLAAPAPEGTTVTAVHWKTGLRYQTGTDQSRLGLQMQIGTGQGAEPTWWQAQADLQAGPLQLRGWWGGGARGTSQLFPTPVVVGLSQAGTETGLSGELSVPVGLRARLGAGLGWVARPTPGEPDGVSHDQQEGWLALEWPVGSQARLALQGRRWWGASGASSWQASALGLTVGVSF